MGMFDEFPQRRAGIGIPGGPRPQLGMAPVGAGLAPPPQANTQEAMAGQISAMNKNPWQATPNHDWASMGGSKGDAINDTIMGRARSFFGDESGALKIPRIGGRAGVLGSGQSSMAAPNPGFAPTPQAGGLSSAGEAAVAPEAAVAAGAGAEGSAIAARSGIRGAAAGMAGKALRGGAIGLGTYALAEPESTLQAAGDIMHGRNPFSMEGISNSIPSGQDIKDKMYEITTGHHASGAPITNQELGRYGKAALGFATFNAPQIGENIGDYAGRMYVNGPGKTLSNSMEHIGNTLFGEEQPKGPVVNGISDPRAPAPVGTFNPIPEGPYRQARLAALAKPQTDGLRSVGIGPAGSNVGIASTPQAAAAQSANQPAGPGAPGITPSQMAPPSVDPIEQGLRKQIQDVVTRNGRAGFVGNEQTRDEWLANHLGMLNQYQHAGAQSEELRGRAAHYRTEAENPLGLPAGVDPAKVMGAKLQVPAESLQAQPWEANPALNAWSKQPTHDLPGFAGAVKTGNLNVSDPRTKAMLNATMARYFPNLPGLYKENAGGIKIGPFGGQSEESRQGQELLRRLRPDIFPQQ